MSGLNKKVNIVVPKEEIRFRQALHHLLDSILAAEQKLGTTFLRKFYLSDAYIRIWICFNKIPSVVFLFPKETDSEPQLVDSHL